MFCSTSASMQLLCPFLGKPHQQPSHPDYVLSVFSYSKTSNKQEDRFYRRQNRLMRVKEQKERELKSKQEERRQKEEEEQRLKEEEDKRRKEAEERQQKDEERRRREEIQREQKEAERKHHEAAYSLVEFSLQEYIKDQGTQTEVAVTNTSQQTEEDLVNKAEALQMENKILRQNAFGVAVIQGNDKATQFYTGLTKYGVFLHLFMFLAPFVQPGRSLSLDEEFFLTLTKLRLNLLLEDLARRYSVSVGVTSKIFQKWIDVMSVRLQFLIQWPRKEVNSSNMPPLFKQFYPNCRVIIDCSEIFIETPPSFDARSKTYSNYKKHNTVKFLIGITPCGSISFLSQCWGGRVSDKNLTQQCGFLELLEPGDVVLADRGFTVEEDLAIHGAKLEIPAFTRGKKQLSQKDVETSQQLSAVRIHVERIIGLLKNRYTILKGPLPVSLLKHKGDADLANIDKVLIVCSALTNLSKSVVS